MKKVLGFCLSVVVLIAALLMGAKLVTARSSSEMAAMVDSFNPLVKPTTYYVLIGKPKQYDSHHTPIYQQTAAAATGQTRPLQFMGMKELQVGKYLAIQSKGAYVMSYHAVSSKQVPQAAFKALN